MRKILIVDDDPDVRSVIRTAVEVEGWESIETDNGTQATNLAAMHQPDAIILDIMMPNMDGFETLKELREDQRTSHISVIMLSAIGDFEIGSHYDPELVGTKAGAAPPDAFLEKPPTHSQIIATINEVCS